MLSKWPELKLINCHLDHKENNNLLIAKFGLIIN